MGLEATGQGLEALAIARSAKIRRNHWVLVAREELVGVREVQGVVQGKTTFNSLHREEKPYHFN